MGFFAVVRVCLSALLQLCRIQRAYLGLEPRGSGQVVLKTRSEWACKPGSVVSDHFSGLEVTLTARCDLPGRQTERTAP